MPPEPRRKPVGIVGGGFSGTMLAAQLARIGIASALIDGTGRAGLGVAYSTQEPAHLLNVRAEAMSAWADAPDDFAKWFAARGGAPSGFAPRQSFGVYLRAILDAAVASGCVKLIEASAVAATPGGDGWTVELGDGSTLDCAALVLANGNQAPEPLSFAAAAGARMINNPWGSEAQAAVRDAAANGDDVLLIGTGLTMVDLVLSLDAAGHRGRIVALSRRGLIPRGHADFVVAPVLRDGPSTGSVPPQDERVAVRDGPLRHGSGQASTSSGLSQDERVTVGNTLALWRWLRRRAGQVGWRAAVDSLRPHSQALWQALPAAEQRRFLRHARPWWDVHRHRIAPEISARLAQMVGEGRLEIRAGRIGAMREVGDGVEVGMRRRGGTPLTLPPLRGGPLPLPQGGQGQKFAFAFNCTGPLGAVGRTNDRLLRGLLDAGSIKPDALGIGLEVDARSRVEGAERLWALGPLTKGRYWEIVAVPDIRGQAAAVAEDIAGVI